MPFASKFYYLGLFFCFCFRLELLLSRICTVFLFIDSFGHRPKRARSHTNMKFVYMARGCVIRFAFVNLFECIDFCASSFFSSLLCHTLLWISFLFVIFGGENKAIRWHRIVYTCFMHKNWFLFHFISLNRRGIAFRLADLSDRWPSPLSLRRKARSH